MGVTNYLLTGMILQATKKKNTGPLQTPTHQQRTYVTSAIFRVPFSRKDVEKFPKKTQEVRRVVWLFRQQKNKENPLQAIYFRIVGAHLVYNPQDPCMVYLPKWTKKNKCR